MSAPRTVRLFAGVQVFEGRIAEGESVHFIVQLRGGRFHVGQSRAIPAEPGREALCTRCGYVGPTTTDRLWDCPVCPPRGRA